MARVGTTFHSGIQGNPFHRCMRCELERRVSDLVWQNGLLICADTCYDNPDAWTRDTLIQETLADGAQDEAQVAEILQGNGNESEPPQP